MQIYKSLAVLLLISNITIAQPSKKVLIIGIDGCRSDALDLANIPTLNQLINQGIYQPHALNDDITISGPGWSAILCGVWSQKHLVTNNSFSNPDYETYPSVFNYVEQFEPELHTVSISQWSPINENIVLDDADFIINAQSGQEVSNICSSYITNNDPDLIFVHFDDIDHAGHNYGFSPNVPQYIQSIESIDLLIAPILNSIQNRITFSSEDWLILVTTDHGGLGTSHGGSSIQEQVSFVIASSPSIKPLVVLRDSIILDNPIINCLENETELTFDGENDFVSIPNHENYNFDELQDFTIECRVRTSLANDVAIITNKDWDTGLNKGFVFSFEYPSGPNWKVNIGDGTQRADIETGGQIANNQWHTLSATFDRDAYLKIYEDGVLLDSIDISNIGDINTKQGLRLGADINQDYPFQGAIEEVRVWNTILDAQTIDDWNCTPIDNQHLYWDNLVGYWPGQNGNNSNTLLDASDFENHGIIDGAAIQNTPQQVTIYNYENTARIVDIVPSALNHLCIPLNPDFDGISLVPECTFSSNLNVGEIGFSIFPNPTSESLIIEFDNENISYPVAITILNMEGQVVYQNNLSNNQNLIQTANLVKGAYLINLKNKNNQSKKWFIVN